MEGREGKEGRNNLSIPSFSSLSSFPIVGSSFMLYLYGKLVLYLQGELVLFQMSWIKLGDVCRTSTSHFNFLSQESPSDSLNLEIGAKMNVEHPDSLRRLSRFPVFSFSIFFNSGKNSHDSFDWIKH